MKFTKENLGDVTLIVGQRYVLNKGVYKWENRQSVGDTCGAYFISDANNELNESNRIKISGSIAVMNNNSYIVMTDSAGGYSGRCSSQKIIDVSFESSEKKLKHYGQVMVKHILERKYACYQM